MHPVRRRKKRPNYGIRTVEVTRGKNGFGFTISGQQPCILSCIVNGSPAEKAGLRPGDYLVAVNGLSVSKLPHDEVVRLIGCLNGVLQLQIAENYYSDSSDEDHIVSIRSKPKFVHKSRNTNLNYRTNGLHYSRPAKAGRNLKTSSSQDKFTAEEVTIPSTFNDSWNALTLPSPRISGCHRSSDSKEELSFVIGYLGTIEMPTQIQPGCRSQVVRGCIKKLRAEKRSHSWVLMRVHADGVTVAGNGGKVLAEYPVNRITFCGPSSEDDKKYFGLVTIAAGDGNEVLPSSSCHVFVVQTSLFEHQKHSAKATSFKITCTSGTLSQGCFEFPSTSEPILNAIKSFCLTKGEENRQSLQNEILLANSPQPSQSGSTAASSNSDSGIGFRDDCGNQSDRIVMVDVENQRLHIQQLYNNKKMLQNSSNSLNIQLHSTDGNLETPSANLQQAFACINALCPLPILDPLCNTCTADHRLSVRAIPDSRVPTSNRSRSPLNSSSSSSDNDKTLTKHTHLKNTTQRIKSDKVGLNLSKPFKNEESTKSFLSNSSYEKSIFYQLGLLPAQTISNGKAKRIHDLKCKANSKSFDNLDNFDYYMLKNESESSMVNKVNSKSTDNLMQMNSNVCHAKSCKLNSQYNMSNGSTVLAARNLNSPLSISYDEGSVIHSNTAFKLLSEEDLSNYCDKKTEVLLSYNVNPDFNFKKQFFYKTVKCNDKEIKQNHFKSVDDMSICSSKSNDAILSYKLSPKVFGHNRPLVTQSLEDLKGSDMTRGSKDQVSDISRIQQWGSLQDLRNLSPKNFEASLIPKDREFDEKESSEEDKRRDGVVSWATSFEKLLEDSAGLNAFAEFLKKEFSQENIAFWVSCERYKELENDSQRKKVASEIYETHLGVGATEPVNVDAHAHQYTQEKVSEAPVDLFVPAQKQIFNLMKFDSYPRFIKSDLYKECLLRELANEELPYSGSLKLPPSLQEKETENTPNRGKLKKSRSDADDCRRKSLLPWHRKNRSKSKDRGESEYKLSTLEQKRENEDIVSVRSEITSSRSSLASWDLALRESFSRQSITSGETSEKENCQLCRVILSDGATTVVQVRQKETVRELINRLLEKRGLHYSSFELYVAGSPKPLPLDEDASTLSNKEVRVEQRIVFRLDLPNRRTVSVKAKATKTLGQVLRSVLHKYSYKLETVTICSMSDNEVLELNMPVTSVNGRRLTVLTRSSAWKADNATNPGSTITSGKTFVKTIPNLDEITNKVFEELLQEKSEGMEKSDQGSIKSEEWGSEHSGVFAKFLRRNSAFHEKCRSKSRGRSRQILEGASKHVEGVVSMVTGKPPLIAKWKSGNKLSGKSESDELYEGLKRAQRSRLEDQRGTEINFELPDFLKDKENAPQSGKKVRKFRREDGSTTPKFYDAEPLVNNNKQQENGQGLLKSSSRTEKLNSIPVTRTETPKQQLITSTKKLELTGKMMSKPLTCKTYVTPKTTPIKNGLASDNLNRNSMLEGNQGIAEKFERVEKNEPPPLPPKPKNLPAKSTQWNHSNYGNRPPQEITNRGPNFSKASDVTRDTKLPGSRRTIYLDQPSSSIV